ncbi:MAG: hypothetical protein JWO15_3431, partial [Sphingomonadales bacterium]|nr:hypothetical protein [Sphingomonadales bacterium]
TGKPLGTDFLAFWSASTLALNGRASAVYDLAQIYAMERGSMPVDPGLSSFLYPPPFLLLCLPLGLAPYFVSLTIWLVTTGAAYWLVVRRWLGNHAGAARGATMTILAYPAVIMNVGHGQNGFLTAALLGGGLWLLDRRPLLAGALLGALIIKPQMAFAIPILILASARWRVMLSGALTALLLCVASWFVFGPGAWNGFLAGGETGRGILEHGLVEPGKLVSVFAAVQVLHGGVALGYFIQGMVAVIAAIVLATVARRRTVQPGGDAALCVCAGALISPFFLDYDLTVMAIPLAWLFAEGLRRGFLPWEKAILVAGYLLPLVARDLALNFGIPIGPLVLIALLSACGRAAVWQAGVDPCVRA